MRNDIKLVIFYILLLVLFSIGLCTENSFCLSMSISLSFSSTGIFIGQAIKRRKLVNVDKGKLGVLLGLFILGIAISLILNSYMKTNDNKIISKHSVNRVFNF